MKRSCSFQFLSCKRAFEVVGLRAIDGCRDNSLVALGRAYLQVCALCSLHDHGRTCGNLALRYLLYIEVLALYCVELVDLAVGLSIRYVDNERTTQTVPQC